MAEIKVPSTIATYTYRNGKQVKSNKTASTKSNQKKYAVNPNYKLDKSANSGKGQYVKVDRTANMSKGKKYYYDLARNDPEAYAKKRRTELEKRKKSDGTYYQSYYEYLAATDPEAYAEQRREYLANRGEYSYDSGSGYEYVPEKRGLLDRVFGVLGYNGIVEGLYNLTDNDDSTTFTQGLKEGLHNMNPFEDDVSQRNTFSDVLKNLGWEDKENGSPNVLRGIAGFVGDVLLDPLTYLNPYASAAKIVKGSGAAIDAVNHVQKAAKAAKIAGQAEDAANGTVRAADKISKIKDLSYEEARQIVRDANRSLTDEEINKLTVQRLRGYESKVKRIVDLDKGNGLSFGLKNAIPGTKKMDKTLDKFTKEFVSSEALRTLGDKTIAPYYNSLMKKVRNSRVAGALSENNRLFRVSNKLDDIEAFKQYNLGQAKKETTKAAQNVNDLNTVDKIRKNLEDSDYTDEEFIKDHQDDILQDVAEYRGMKANVIKEAAENKPVNKYGYNESEKKILEGRAETLRSDVDKVFEKSSISKEEFLSKYENYNSKNLSSDLGNVAKEIDDYGTVNNFDTKYAREAEAMFGKSIVDLNTAEKAKFYSLMSMFENSSGQIKWRDVLKTMSVPFTKKTITHAKEELLKTLGKNDNAAKWFSDMYKTKRGIQTTNNFSELYNNYNFLSNYNKVKLTLDELDTTESALKNLYSDDDFILDVEEGLYDAVIQNRQLKIYATQKVLESQRKMADTTAKIEEIRAAEKRIVEAKQELTDLQNAVTENYKEVINYKSTTDYKSISNIIKEKEKELHYLEKNTDKKIDRSYKKIDKITEQQRTIESDILTAKDNLNLLRKYWREIQMMTGKNVDDIDIDDVQRCFGVLRDLEKISVGDNINWENVLSNIDSESPEILNRLKIFDITKQSTGVYPEMAAKDFFFGLTEDTREFLINEMKEDIEANFFSKIFGMYTEGNIEVVRKHLDEFIENTDFSKLTNYENELINTFDRYVDDVVGKSKMYYNTIGKLVESFENIFSKMPSSNELQRDATNIMEAVLSYDGSKKTLSIINERRKATKLFSKFIDNNTYIKNLEQTIDDVIDKHDIDYGNLTDEIRELKTQIREIEYEELFRKQEFNDFLKSGRVNDRIIDLSNEISELNKIIGTSVADDIVVYSSADDYLTKSMRVTLDDLKRIEKLDANEGIIELHKTFADRMSDIAEREFKAGRLSREQINALDGTYMHRILSDKAKEIIKNNPNIYKDTGKFNPSAHGSKRSFDQHRMFKTMADGEKWWIERNKQVMFDDALEKGMSEEDVLKFVEDNFDEKAIGKLYKYNVAEMYITRAIGSNELLLSTDINNFVKKSLCTPYTPNQANDMYKDKIVASYIDVYNNLSHYFNKNKEELTEQYGNVKNFIDSVVREAGMDEQLFAKSRDFSALESGDINTALFSPNFAYFDLTDAQRQIFQKYSDKPIELWNMDKGVYNLVNKFTKDQTKLMQSSFMNFYDKWLTRWKVFNILSPGFHLQNAASNTFQSFLAIGSDAFNPKKIKKAVDVYRTKDPKQTLTLAGKKYTYKQLADLVDEYKIVANTFFDEDVLSKSNEKGIIGKLYNVHGKFGADIESTGRINLFFSALDSGHTPEEAAEMVDKFLFDYSDLTQAEKNIMKRIIPFYSFMRKNIPLMLEQMLEQPNTFNNLNKAFTEIEKMNPDYVPENDRNEYRQDYIQFPFDVDGKQYGISDQLPYTQLDRVFSLKSTDNIPVPLPRQLMGQTSPVLKLPFELITGENAYSGFPIDSKGRYIANLLGGNAATVANAVNKKTPEEGLTYGLSKFFGFPINTITDYSVPPWER